MDKWAKAAVICAFLCFAVQHAVRAAVIQGLSLNSVAALSGDGHSAVGMVGIHPELWRAGSGAAALSLDGTLVDLNEHPFPLLAGQPGFSKDFVKGISFDGSVIVGDTQLTGTNPELPDPLDFRAWTWMAGSGVQILDADMNFTPHGISGDGSVVVASVSNAGAYTWAADTGWQSVSSRLQQPFARSISSNGNVVVGFALNRKHRAHVAARWSRRGSAQLLGDSLGDSQGSDAFDVSGNGRVVVGLASVRNRTVPFRWTQATGMLPLQGFPHGARGEAVAVSDDGKFILGDIDGSVQEPFLWDKKHGVRTVESILEKADVDLIDWPNLGHAVDLSADGKVIVGVTNENPSRAWIVDLHVTPVILENTVLAVPEPDTFLMMVSVMSVLLPRQYSTIRRRR